MKFKAVFIFLLAALPAFLFAEEADAQAAEPVQENVELENELKYVEALIDSGFPDFATIVSEEVKKRWPESEARLFAFDVRGLLACGQIKEAEAKIAALPDRTGTKYWAARLEMANSLFQRGQKDECMKIYEEFFDKHKKPPKDIAKFYNSASWIYGQLLMRDNKPEKAVARYEYALKNLKGEEWCNLACETADIYLKLIENAESKAKRDEFIKAATRIVNKLLFQFEMPIYFGRGVSMKAHIEQIKGDSEKAAATIEEYKPQLDDLHAQILENDPEGKLGLLRQSPLPQCLYLKAKVLWDEAKKEYASPTRKDERVKELLFGKKVGGRRKVETGAFAIAQGIFLNYETSSWAPAAGDMAQEIREFAEQKYNAKIKTRVTKEQREKVRVAQFREANEKYVAGLYKEAVVAYYDVLSRYPEHIDSIAAVEKIALILLDEYMEATDEAVKEEKRLDCDTVEGYLSERFAGVSDNLIMTSAGDALVRLAAKESEYRNMDRSDALYAAFCGNYTRHAAAPATASSKASELQKKELYDKAIYYWGFLDKIYTNSVFHIMALSQLSYCYGKLGDSTNEINYIARYVAVEKNQLRKLQAQLRLAQMYQKSGLDILNSCTNHPPEEIEALERKGTAQNIRAIQNFVRLEKEAGEALANPATPASDKEKFVEAREAAKFLIGECFSRMKRPEKNLEMYRKKAAESYEAYLGVYPQGRWAEHAYVKLGMIYTALGDVVKSKDALDKLTRLFPDSDSAKNAKPRLAKSLIEIGMKKEGAQIYAEMIGTDGKYTAAQYLNAGEALVESGNWDLANRAYEKAIRLAPSNSVMTVARARLGIAKTSWKQGSLDEAREALDLFLADQKMSKLPIAADAYFMLVDVARQQGRGESDAKMRDKYFGAAALALRKVRAYWAKKPKWEQDKLTLTSGDLIIERMEAEEKKGFKEEAKRSCEKAASVFQVFIQSNGPTESMPISQMSKEELANLEIAYARVISLFAKLGSEQSSRVISCGNEYIKYFPEGKYLSDVNNYMNRAKADIPASSSTEEKTSEEGEGQE